MKRILFIIATVALLSQAALVFAQDSGEPSIQSVLDAARAKYWQDKAPKASSETQADAPDSARSDQVPYTPVLVSFVPGVSFPFGYYDVSLAGGAIGNLARDISGAEGAGVFNISRDVRGIQGAGVFNLSRNVLGLQDAGVFNVVAEDITGLQGAGVFNVVHGKIAGLQAAGVFNIAGRVVGGQAAGVFNQASRVTGVQVGLVNVAEYIDGVQIGLVNIAGNGVGSVGATWEPTTNYTYVHWQAGTPAFFTVIGVGAPSSDWFNDYTGFVASFGLGSRTRLFGLNIDLDVSAEQPIGTLPFDTLQNSSDPGAWEGWAMIRPYPSVRLMAGLPLGRHFQIVGGVKADIDFDSWATGFPMPLRRVRAGRGRFSARASRSGPSSSSDSRYNWYAPLERLGRPRYI